MASLEEAESLMAKCYEPTLNTTARNNRGRLGEPWLCSAQPSVLPDPPLEATTELGGKAGAGHVRAQLGSVSSVVLTLSLLSHTKPTEPQPRIYTGLMPTPVVTRSQLRYYSYPYLWVLNT